MTHSDYTAQEYFDRRRERLFGDAHAHIATSCITYLNCTTFADAGSSVPTKDLLEIFNYYDEKTRRHPLTQYAVSTWAYHAHNTEDTLLIDTLLSFLNQNMNVVRAVGCEHFAGGFTWRPGEQFSAIHIAAIYGLIKRTIYKRRSTGRGDSRGHTPNVVVINFLPNIVPEWYNILAVRLLVDEGLDLDKAQTLPQKALEYLPPPLPKSPLERHELRARRSAIVQFLSNEKSGLDSKKHKVDSMVFSLEIFKQLFRQIDRGARARK